MNRRKLLGLVSQMVVANAAGPLRLLAAAPAATVFRVREYGARGDGRTLDTAAIQKTLDRCTASGGGIVRLEPGTYLSGALILRDGITFQIEKGATLLGSANIADYRGSRLLTARKAKGISIVGEGTIDGNGKSFWVPNPRHRKPAPENAWTDVPQFYWKELSRPGQMISLEGCTDLHFSGITLTNSPAWTLRLLDCDGVQVQGIKIDNPRYGINTDGIDVVCSSNVEIHDCHIVTGDDGIVLKSEGPQQAIRPTRNVRISRCYIDTPCNGVKIGTGTQGAFENIDVRDCELRSDYPYIGDRMISGIAVEMVDGGSVRSFAANNIKISGARTPIFIRLGNRGTGQASPTAGTIEDISISNVIATGASVTSSIMGLPNHPVVGVKLVNINIATNEAGKPQWFKRPIPEVEAVYPEARMFGRLPASGLYCRHASRIELSNLSITMTEPDFRPALVCDGVTDLHVKDLRVAKAEAEIPVVSLKNIRRVVFEKCVAPKGTENYLSVDHSSRNEVSMRDCDLRHARLPIGESNA